MTPVAYRSILTRTEFDALAEQWDVLVRSARRPSPFMLHGWLSAWWQHHGSERSMRIEVALDGTRLVGGVPLEIESGRGLRVAHLMGRHHAALGDLLVSPGLESSVGAGLLQRVRDVGADYVDLFGLAETGVLLGTLQPVRAAFIRRAEAPVLDISAGWEATYRSKTSSKRRGLHKRRRRQLGELGKLEIEVARDEEDLASALVDAFRLHDLRWSGRPDSSEFTTQAGRRFHVAAVRALARSDVPRILTVRIDGRAIAFHYYFLLEGSMYVHRLAFDPELGRLSPGQIATLAAIEAAAGEGAGRVEFLGGAERYKLDIADGVEPLYALIGLPGSVRGRAAAAVAVRRLELRLRLKRSRRLRSFYFERLAPIRRALSRGTAQVESD